MLATRHIQPECTITVPYTPPMRYGKKTPAEGMHWHIDVDDPIMRDRAEVMMHLDPALPPEDAAWFAYTTWGNFLCRCCGSALVFDGQNGAGTPSLLCKTCDKNMSIWNTYELTVWRYKKTLSAMLHYIYGGSVESSSRLYGIGTGALNEIRMCLPDLQYSRSGPLEAVEYDGKRYGVVTIDMIYKGQKGVMLGVSGGLCTTSLGNESSGEGLQEFFDEVERGVGADNYIFVMDMRLTVARMILERWGEKAIIVLQNHSVWGDVLVYFYRDGWYTLRLRTDAFSEASRKRCEEALLGVGEIELYEGLKGVKAGASFKDVTGDRLREGVEELIAQLGNVVWDEKGRVDLVMRPKLTRLNGLLRELQRRGVDTSDYINMLCVIMDDLIGRYATTINRVVKRKIVNAWRALTLLEDDVNRLSELLLKEPLPSSSKGKVRVQGARREGARERWVRFLTRPKLVYRGRMDDDSVPEQALWILGLLIMVFGGREITTNPCEGMFGVIGMALRQGRSIYLERAVTKVHLQKQEIGATLSWLVGNCPIQDIGRRGMRGTRRRLVVGGRYLITYVDRRGGKTERVIDVIERKRKMITAMCHMRQAIRTFKRSRIKSITPLQISP